VDFVCLFVVLALVCVWFDFDDLFFSSSTTNSIGEKTAAKFFSKENLLKFFCFLFFRSNLIYYPLAQQSTMQQPIYLTPTNGGTGTTWPSNLFSQFSLGNLSTGSTTNVSTTLNPGTSSPQTVYEVPTALFEPNGIASSSPTIAGSAQTAGQQLYWSSYS